MARAGAGGRAAARRGAVTRGGGGVRARRAAARAAGRAPATEEPYVLGGARAAAGAQPLVELPNGPMGLGCWSWGNTSFWNDGDWTPEMRAAASETYDAASAAGLRFWDTAEACTCLTAKCRLTGVRRARGLCVFGADRVPRRNAR